MSEASLEPELEAATKNRILHGKLSLEVARFGLPLGLGMGLQTAFNLVDAYVISRLEPEVAGPALGALGICDLLSALGTIISYGLSTATVALISRRHGEGNTEAVRRLAWQSTLLVTAIGAVFFLVGVAGARTLMVDIVGAKGQVAELGTEYVRVTIGGSVTIFLLLHLTSLMRALGSSKTPISLLIGANVLNFVLSILLVYGAGETPAVFSWGPPLAEALGLPRMGLVGAAWATVAARLLALAPLIAISMWRFELFRRDSRSAPDSDMMRGIVKLGWPSSAQLVLRMLAMLLTQSLVNRAFTTDDDPRATTALGIVFRLETMALFMSLGWGSAAQTFMGQNLGAGAPQRAKQSGWLTAVYASLTLGALAVAYRVWAAPLIRFFDSDPEVVRLGLDYLRWVAPSYVCMGLAIVLGSAIQGAGATRQTLLLDGAVVVGLQLPASLVAVYAVDAGPLALWQAIALTYVAFALVYGVAYRRGNYLNTKLS